MNDSMLIFESGAAIALMVVVIVTIRRRRQGDSTHRAK